MLLWLWIVVVISHLFQRNSVWGQAEYARPDPAAEYVSRLRSHWHHTSEGNVTVLVSLGVRTRAKDLTPLLLTKSIESVMAAPRLPNLPCISTTTTSGLSTCDPLPQLIVWGWLHEPHFLSNQRAYSKLRESGSPRSWAEHVAEVGCEHHALWTMLSAPTLHFLACYWCFLPSQALREETQIWNGNCAPLSHVSQGHPQWPFPAPWLPSDLCTSAALPDSSRRWKSPPRPVAYWTLRGLTSKQQSPHSWCGPFYCSHNTASVTANIDCILFPCFSNYAPRNSFHKLYHCRGGGGGRFQGQRNLESTERNGMQGFFYYRASGHLYNALCFSKG